ncbi:hypothetical protein MRX96_056328 [Rhipicephalus microplus]
MSSNPGEEDAVRKEERTFRYGMLAEKGCTKERPVALSVVDYKGTPRRKGEGETYRGTCGDNRLSSGADEPDLSAG